MSNDIGDFIDEAFAAAGVPEVVKLPTQLYLATTPRSALTVIGTEKQALAWLANDTTGRGRLFRVQVVNPVELRYVAPEPYLTEVTNTPKADQAKTDET